MNNKELLSIITIHPEVCSGNPCIHGLRYPVSSILEYLSGGDSTQDTSQLSEGNSSKDQEILRIASGDGVIISKDDDFYQSFLLYRKPVKLLYVR